MTIIKKPQMDNCLNDEWLVTNGIGGYACGSICGTPLRRYHSLLNAALPAPFGRMVMLNYVADILVIDEKQYLLSTIQKENEDNLPVDHYLKEFRIENGLPFWVYQIENVVLEKSLFLIHHQNTVCVSYKVLETDKPLELHWRPYLHFRMNEQPVNQPIPNETYTVQVHDFEYEITCPDLPALRITNPSKPSFTLNAQMMDGIYYELEAKRGYEAFGNLMSPGFFSQSLELKQRTTFTVSTETWDALRMLSCSEAWNVEKWRKRNILKCLGPLAKDRLMAKLAIAADQFIITPVTRYKDLIRLKAAGEEVKTIIAGYPWFTDWGRDTMISLEGLTLSTGRYNDAFTILHTFSYYIKDGLIPNMFPEGENQGIYNTADATLWYFHAIDRYIAVTGDSEILEFLLPRLKDIIDHHIRGTLFGIRLDDDGLLIQGDPGFALTWMDAKLQDWIVTPRRGKAVEINALWYNALNLYEEWTGKTLEWTSKCQESFNQKFWYEEGGYLFDLIDQEKGADTALRPNQLFAISLKYPVLESSRWGSVLQNVQKELLTPVGLRTLSPSHPDYKAIYDGDLQARDSSYHQGTIWPWLIGPYIDAWQKTYPEDPYTAASLLTGLRDHLSSGCLGSIGEIFDSTPPYHARGCFAQAWSVAEFLRCLIKTPFDKT